MQESKTMMKSADEMSVGELQTEISRLTQILYFKLCGDPRNTVTTDLLTGLINEPTKKLYEN